MSLASAAHEVHNFLKSAATKEHFIDLIDWVEDQRPKPLISRAFTESEKTVSILVSSGQRFSIMDKMDFGWGKLVFGSCHVPAKRRDCYVITMGSPIKDEDWIVYMHLPQKHLIYIEVNASQMFNPLTSYYLKI